MEPSSIVCGQQPVIIGNGIELGSVGMVPPVDPALLAVDDVCIAESEPMSSQDLSDNEQNSMVLMLPPSPETTQVPDSSDIFLEHYDVLAEYDLSGNHSNLVLDPDPMSLHLTAVENLDLLFNPHGQYPAAQGSNETFS
jgi:hypothetical protein